MKDGELSSSKAALERFTNAVRRNLYNSGSMKEFNILLFQTTKNSLSELEKRERRAMERKMSEMEEELKVIIWIEALRKAMQLNVITTPCSPLFYLNIITYHLITWWSPVISYVVSWLECQCDHYHPVLFVVPLNHPMNHSLFIFFSSR